MENEKIFQKLEEIEKYLLGMKKILNVEELSKYTGLKPSYIYKLVHRKIIPFSKPNGKLLFFDREKIDGWLLKNHSSSIEETYIDLVFNVLGGN